MLAGDDYRVGEIGPEDSVRVVHLYNQLYLDKYSQHNPHFSVALVALWQRTGVLRMWGLRTREGRLDGVVGVMQSAGRDIFPVVNPTTM